MNKPLKDHRQIGQELDLFSFHDVAPGAVFWHPKGWIIYKTLENFIRERITSEGYTEISTPVMVKTDLFKQSGHWEFYKENMFNLSIWDKEEEELAQDQILQRIKVLPDSFEGTTIVRINIKNEIFDVPIHLSHAAGGSNISYNLPVNHSLKPMNCPESALVYKTKVRSYNDLPIRYSEFGILNRNELSGVLGGALRVRQFVIDDAHIYARPDQILEEIHNLLKLTLDTYESLNFKPHFYLATRPDKAMGDKKVWDEAEKDLEEALKKADVKYDLKPKDGAFYGPKIDIHIKDSQDRDWQLATIQLDFQIPERMNVKYIDKEGKEKTPVIIHRGIFGSLERFIAILTEHFQGSFPLWLSPVQVVIVPISDKHAKHAQKIASELKGIRVEVDERSETMQSKIREATLQRAPYIAIIGDKEIEANSVSVRTREGKDLGSMKLSEFIKLLEDQIDKKI